MLVGESFHFCNLFGVYIYPHPSVVFKLGCPHYGPCARRSQLYGKDTLECLHFNIIKIPTFCLFSPSFLLFSFPFFLFFFFSFWLPFCISSSWAGIRSEPQLWSMPQLHPRRILYPTLLGQASNLHPGAAATPLIPWRHSGNSMSLFYEDMLVQ